MSEPWTYIAAIISVFGGGVVYAIRSILLEDYAQRKRHREYDDRHFDAEPKTATACTYRTVARVPNDNSGSTSMSVMKCDRLYCEHTMCDRLILDDTKYICSDCWTELLEWKDSQRTEHWTKASVREMLENFMGTKPGTYCTSPEDVEAEFKRLTGVQRNYDDR